MVAKRRRQHPLQFGRASTFVETIEQPELEEMSERFLRAIDYYGLVELEYKLDPRDGKFKMLDVNARTWGYHTLGASAGVDFSYMLFADQMGLPVSPVKARPGVGWMRATTDIPTVCLEFLAGSMGPRGYLRSLGMCRTEAVFSLEDPLPGVAELFLIPYLAVKRGF
jgi:predicted ATP-grasp superfamily ATP-dependent carboligase